MVIGYCNFNQLLHAADRLLAHDLENHGFSVLLKSQSTLVKYNVDLIEYQELVQFSSDLMWVFHV